MFKRPGRVSLPGFLAGAFGDACRRSLKIAATCVMLQNRYDLNRSFFRPVRDAGRVSYVRNVEDSK